MYFCIFHKVGVNLFFFHVAYQFSLHHVFKTPPCPTILQGCPCHRSGFHRAFCAASLVCSPVLGLVCCSLVTKSCSTLCYPTQWTEISQAKILERVAISFLRGSSRPRDRTRISCTGSGILYCWVTREALLHWSHILNYYNFVISFHKNKSCHLFLCLLRASWLFCTFLHPFEFIWGQCADLESSFNTV